MLGASAHVGWLVHEMAPDDPPVQVVTVPGPPIVVQLPAAAAPTAAAASDTSPDTPAAYATCGGMDRSRHARKSKRERRHRIEGADAAISCSDETTCTIDRTLLAKILDDPRVIAKQGRLVPSIRDGKSRGLKLYGVRRGSLPALLGLRNGDLLVAVNDHALDSPSAAMSVFSTLSDSDPLLLEIDRRGQSLTMEYSVR